MHHLYHRPDLRLMQDFASIAISQRKLNKNEISVKFQSMIPTLEEQTKIGSFFKQLDDTITLHQRKLDLAQGTEKRLLAKNVP